MSSPFSNLGATLANPFRATAAGQTQRTPAASAPGSPGAVPSSASGGTPTSSTTTPTASSQDIAGTDTFLKLLVAQLRNQDPTAPMDSQGFITEMAQFNTVEQMINLKQAVTNQVNTQQAVEGVALLNKTVTYSVPGIGTQQGTISQGVVTGVSLLQGKVQLQVGTQQVPLDTVSAVSG